MSIADNIKEFWSHWIEISEEEYLQNKQDKENYTYLVDQDTNKVVRFMKRVTPCNNYSINTIQCPMCGEWILKENKNISKEEYIKMNTNTIENANDFLNRIGAYEINTMEDLSK